MAQRLKKQGCRKKNFPSALLSPSHAYLSSPIPSFFIQTPHPFYYLFIYLVCKGVGSSLRLGKRLAEKSQGRMHQSLPFLKKSALL